MSFPTVSVEKVSLSALLANPNNYDGKCVQTVGVLSVEFEGGRIFIDRTSYVARAYENAVRQPFVAAVVAMNSEDPEKAAKRISDTYEGKLVRVIGVFSAINTRTDEISSNSMFKDISFIETLPPHNWAQIGNRRTCL
ncbi:hypothetical protein OM33_11320 [Pseudoalteromonas piratica]|uniref:Uncharacterized protein n=1 Tax=Pseudoalteromonas piratica TaxID=1348114 RepID=A0A0A7EJX8_9GAMM|nr:hypothetical protein OM33_11320 [Pseudoalteromonas piratica]